MPQSTPLHLPVSPGADDPLGIAQVSGLYGPGTWAGWYMTLVSSWIILLRGGKLINTHFVGFVLFTNWTAIDLFRQSCTWVPRDTGTTTPKKPTQAAIAAAFTMTFWGFHATAYQIAFWCIRRYISPSRRKVRIKRYANITLLSVIIPLSSFLALFSRMPNYTTSFEFSYGEHDLLLPALYHNGISPMIHVSTIYYANFYSIALFWPALVFLLLFRGTDHNSSGVSVWVSVIYVCFTAHSVFSSIFYIWRILATRGKIMSKSCFFMPCAPQHISDWDQAFGVFVGLGTFLYEFGGELGRIVLRVVDAAVKWLGWEDWWERVKRGVRS